MGVHYKKLNNVKSAIDNKPPKSSLTSVKARDSQRRRGSAILKTRPIPTKAPYYGVSSYDFGAF